MTETAASDIPSIVQYAQQLSREGKADEAEERFSQALELDPSNEQTKLAVAQHYKEVVQRFSQEGKEKESIEALLKATRYDPHFVTAQAHIDLAYFCMHSGRGEEALVCLDRALLVDPSYSIVHQRRAEFLPHFGRIGESIESLKQYLKLNPELSEHSNHVHVSLSLPARIGRLEEALETLTESLLDLGSQHGRILQRALDLATDATRFVSTGELEKARRSIEQALALRADWPEALFNLGLILHTYSSLSGSTKLQEEALNSFVRACELKPNWAAPYHQIGKIFAAHGRHSDNLLYQQKAISLDAAFESAHLEASDMLERTTGFTAEYQSHIQRAIEIRNQELDKHPLGKLGIRFLDANNTYAMGHLAQLPEVYVKMQKLGWLPEYRTILMAPPWKIANPCLFNYWSRYFELASDEDSIRKLRPIAKELTFNSAYYKLPDGKAYSINFVYAAVEKEWEAQGREPLLTLSEEDLAFGFDSLEKMGMPRGAWFVPIHARHAGFKAEGTSTFYQHKHAEIADYIPAIEAITSRGGWVIRVGEPSMPPLPKMDGVIDYAHSPLKSSRLDVFILSQGRFFIATSGGAFGTPNLFGVPVLFTNFPLFEPLHFSSRDLHLYRRIYEKSSQHFLSFKQVFSPPFFYCSENKVVYERGLDFMKNSPEEIRAATEEMIERADKSVVYSVQDDELQRRFRELLPKTYAGFTTRVARQFLRENSALLDG